MQPSHHLLELSRWDSERGEDLEEDVLMGLLIPPVGVASGHGAVLEVIIALSVLGACRGCADVVGG
jgi:hypothetical protein